MLSTVASVVATTIGAISWEPEIRGSLVVLISVVVLCGSVYLIVATNTGARLGFLLAFTGFMGWMLIMGVIWTLYGIGLVGESPSWQVVESIVGELDQAETAVVRDLGDWEELPEGDPSRGEAQAAVDEFLAESGLVPAGASPVTVSAFEIGGKDELEGDVPCSVHRPDTWDGCWDRIWQKAENTVQITHPTHYAAIRVGLVDEEEPVVEAPPPDEPSLDQDQLITVVMVRDLGNKRFPPAMVTVFSGIMFGLGAYQLHRRDQLSARARAGATT